MLMYPIILTIENNILIPQCRNILVRYRKIEIGYLCINRPINLETPFSKKV